MNKNHRMICIYELKWFFNVAPFKEADSSFAMSLVGLCLAGRMASCARHHAQHEIPSKCKATI